MAAGRKALAKATPGVLAADESLLEALAATRRGTFVKALSSLTEEAEAPAPAPAPKPKAAPKPVKKAAPKAAPAKAKKKKTTKKKKKK
jgi:hypothetical protein